MRKTRYLSKIMTLIYLFHEFGNGNLKVTTVLDDNGCWVGKVILESTNKPAEDDKEMAEFYTEALCREVL